MRRRAGRGGGLRWTWRGTLTAFCDCWLDWSVSASERPVRRKSATCTGRRHTICHGHQDYLIVQWFAFVLSCLPQFGCRKSALTPMNGVVLSVPLACLTLPKVFFFGRGHVFYESECRDSAAFLWGGIFFENGVGIMRSTFFDVENGTGSFFEIPFF